MTTEAEPCLAQIWIYPIKSCRGIRLSSAQISSTGLLHDREYILCEIVQDEAGDDIYRMLTMRNEPRMGLIDTAIDGDILNVSVARHLLSPGTTLASAEFHISRSSHSSEAKQVDFKLHKAEVSGIDLGAKASAFFSGFLQRNVRIIQTMPGTRLFVPKPFANSSPMVKDREAAFQDQFPLLVMSMETINWINQSLDATGEAALESQRFRPNLILTGISAFEEDNWQRISIGEHRISMLSRCGRCLLPNVNPATGQKNKNNQPYKLLSTMRKIDLNQPKIPVLGMHSAFEDTKGQVRVGDVVTLLVRAKMSG